MRGHTYERYFAASGVRSEQRMLDMYRRSHRLKRLPPFPGVQNWHHSSSSRGRMENYTRGGGSPGSGFWNKPDGGNTYGAGTVWRQGGERPGPTSFPPREPGLPGGVQESITQTVPEPVKDAVTEEPEVVNVATVEATQSSSGGVGGGVTLKDLLRQTAASKKQQQQQQQQQQAKTEPAPKIAAAVHKAPPTKLVAEPPSLEVVTVTASIRQQTPVTVHAEPPSLETATASTRQQTPVKVRAEPPSLETAPVSDNMSRGDLPGVPNVDDMIARMSRSLGRPYSGK